MVQFPSIQQSKQSHPSKQPLSGEKTYNKKPQLSFFDRWRKRSRYRIHISWFGGIQLYTVGSEHHEPG